MDSSNRELRPPAAAVSPAMTYLAVALAWLVPGAGHVFLGRRGRGVGFLRHRAGDHRARLRAPGQALPRRRPAARHPGHAGAAPGMGLPYFLLYGLGYTGDIDAAGYEYGTAFVLTAGLMNMLLVLDAWDIAARRQGMSHFNLMVAYALLLCRVLRPALAARAARAVEALPAALPRPGGRRDRAGLADVSVPRRSAAADSMKPTALWRRRRRRTTAGGRRRSLGRSPRRAAARRARAAGAGSRVLRSRRRRAARRRFRQRRPQPRDRGGRDSPKCSACCQGAPHLPRPAGGDRAAAAGGRAADRLAGVQPAPGATTAQARRARRLLHQPAGLGLAAGAGGVDRAAGPQDAGAVRLRGGLLPAARS